MTWFTGVDTGRRYEVGQTYANGNGVYRANADGSFTNLNSGRTAVGSSQSDNVQWGGYSGRLSEASRGGVGVSHVSTGPASSASVGPGNGAVQPDKPTAQITGPGGPRVQYARPAGSAPITTQLWVDGHKLALDETTSDGGDGEQRWGEWGGALYGLEVMRRDIWEMSDARNGGVLKTDNIERAMHGTPAWLADGTVDFAGFLDAQKARIAADRTARPGEFGGEATVFKTGGGF